MTIGLGQGSGKHCSQLPLCPFSTPDLRLALRARLEMVSNRFLLFSAEFVVQKLREEREIWTGVHRVCSSTAHFSPNSCTSRSRRRKIREQTVPTVRWRSRAISL